MLGKYMKHEFKETGKLMIPLNLVILVFTLLGMVMLGSRLLSTPAMAFPDTLHFNPFCHFYCGLCVFYGAVLQDDVPKPGIFDPHTPPVHGKHCKHKSVCIPVLGNGHCRIYNFIHHRFGLHCNGAGMGKNGRRQ